MSYNFGIGVETGPLTIDPQILVESIGTNSGEVLVRVGVLLSLMDKIQPPKNEMLKIR